MSDHGSFKIGDHMGSLSEGSDPGAYELEAAEASFAMRGQQVPNPIETLMSRLPDIDAVIATNKKLGKKMPDTAASLVERARKGARARRAREDPDESASRASSSPVPETPADSGGPTPTISCASSNRALQVRIDALGATVQGLRDLLDSFMKAQQSDMNKVFSIVAEMANSQRRVEGMVRDMLVASERGHPGTSSPELLDIPAAERRALESLGVLPEDSISNSGAPTSYSSAISSAVKGPPSRDIW